MVFLFIQLSIFFAAGYLLLRSLHFLLSMYGENRKDQGKEEVGGGVTSAKEPDRQRTPKEAFGTIERLCLIIAITTGYVAIFFYFCVLLIILTRVAIW